MAALSIMTVIGLFTHNRYTISVSVKGAHQVQALTRSKGLHQSLGSLTDCRLQITFEPFPTSETKKGLKAERGEAYTKRSTERDA